MATPLKPSIQQHLLAGTVAGSVTTLALYPLDLIKVRYQVHEGIGSAYTSLSAAFRTIHAREGLAGLYQGVAPALIASAASWGGYFYFYEKAKDRKSNQGTLGALDHLLAGTEAGSIMVLLTNPFWLIKTRLQIQGQSTDGKKYKGFIDALITIPKEEGLLGLYKGIIPALLLTSHGAIQFMVYEYLKKWSAQFRSAGIDTQPPLVSLFIGGLSKIIAATVTYPYQVVKSRLQQREALPEIEQLARGRKTKAKYSGTFDCLRKIWINEGLRGYFKGLIPNVLRVAPSAALTLLLYEECLKIS